MLQLIKLQPLSEHCVLIQVNQWGIVLTKGYVKSPEALANQIQSSFDGYLLIDFLTMLTIISRLQGLGMIEGYLSA